MIDLDKIIKSTLKSGKAYLGSKQTMNAAKTGKAVILILASNCPEKFREDIQHYANLSKIPLYTYSGSALDLGMACGRTFMVSAMTIRTLSDPELLKMVRKEHGQEAQS